MTGRFVDPAPRRALLARLRIAPPALIASGHVHQYRESWLDGARHAWALLDGSTIIPDRRQPLYGLKQVGYVEHRLEPDGGTKAGWCRCPAWRPLNIADFPEAMGRSSICRQRTSFAGEVVHDARAFDRLLKYRRFG